MLEIRAKRDVWRWQRDARRARSKGGAASVTVLGRAAALSTQSMSSRPAPSSRAFASTIAAAAASWTATPTDL